METIADAPPSLQLQRARGQFHLFFFRYWVTVDIMKDVDPMGSPAFAITLHETFSCLAKVRVEHIHPISALDAHVESYKRRECLYQAVEWEIELHR